MIKKILNILLIIFFSISIFAEEYNSEKCVKILLKENNLNYEVNSVVSDFSKSEYYTLLDYWETRFLENEVFLKFSKKGEKTAFKFSTETFVNEKIFQIDTWPKMTTDMIFELSNKNKERKACGILNFEFLKSSKYNKENFKIENLGYYKLDETTLKIKTLENYVEVRMSLPAYESEGGTIAEGDEKWGEIKVVRYFINDKNNNLLNLVKKYKKSYNAEIFDFEKYLKIQEEISKNYSNVNSKEKVFLDKLNSLKIQILKQKLSFEFVDFLRYSQHTFTNDLFKNKNLDELTKIIDTFVLIDKNFDLTKFVNSLEFNCKNEINCINEKLDLSLKDYENKEVVNYFKKIIMENEVLIFENIKKNVNDLKDKKLLKEITEKNTDNNIEEDKKSMNNESTSQSAMIIVVLVGIVIVSLGFFIFRKK